VTDDILLASAQNNAATGSSVQEDGNGKMRGLLEMPLDAHGLKRWGPGITVFIMKGRRRRVRWSFNLILSSPSW
jgi:hypothetical protein